MPLGMIERFVAALGSDFEVDRDMLRDALLHGRSCNIFFLPVVMKIDIFAVGQEPYDEVEFSRRRRALVNDAGDELVIKSPEDTILRKLLWYRAGGEVSDRQWRDVVEVLRVSGPELDTTYLRTWASRLRLTSSLERATAEAAEASR
jgi:hypothetical protein